MSRAYLALGALALLATSPVSAEIARIKVASGTASIERNAKLIKATPGLQLAAGDKLVTGKDGRMSLTFVDNTRFAVGPNSRVSVNQFIALALAEKVGSMNAAEFFAERGKNGDVDWAIAFLESRPE